MEIGELSVLVVEPSQAQFLVLQAMLSEVGVGRVRHAADGGGALAALAEAPAGLVISAMHLSDMTGADLVVRMRADGRWADTPFMLVCSERAYRYLEPVRQAGAVAIVHKPAEPELLRRGLYAAMDLAAPESLGAQHPEIHGFHVLVVDDSATSRQLIRTVLENLGVELIREAVDGREAMALIEEELFDLVVTDYHMPQVDGEALIRFIREESPQGAVPILMVTSETDESRLAAIEQSGVSSLCNKPFEPAVVRELLERVLLFGR
ncbi:response regulator [Endothiovibrio diazotrophicus]